MFSKMKIGTKIALGFILILLIAGIIGLIAVFNMMNIQSQATELSNAYVPEVEIANNIQENTLMMLYSIRGYSLSKDEAYLKEGNDYLALLKNNIKSALSHVIENPQLKILEQKAKEAETKTLAYEALIGEAKNKIDASNNYLAQMNQSAVVFINNCEDYLSFQNEKIEEQFTDGSTAEELSDRLWKITVINNIIDSGNSIRLDNFKAQSTNDINLFENTLKKFDEINLLVKQLELKTIQTANINQLNLIKSSMESYKSAMSSFLANWKDLNGIQKQRETIGQNVLDAAKEISRAGISQTKEIAVNTTNSLASSTIVIIVGLSIAVILGSILAFIIIRGITKPVNRIVKDLNQGSDQVASASEQLSSASQQLAEGSSEQASALEETSATLNEATSMIQQTTENTNQASILSKKTKESAVSGNNQMQEMMGAMSEIKKSSDEISKIIKVIDEIAFQTNILSLNAAVEAARAGEAGAGFAVVAEEVRNLAHRSAQAAKDTAVIIEKNIQLSDKGVSVAEKVGNALIEINEHATKVNSLIDEINAASNEQAQGINQINTAVAQMEQVTQQNAANAEESASASEELSAQAESMKEIVSQLNMLVTGKDEIITTHKATSGINYKNKINTFSSTAQQTKRGLSSGSTNNLVAKKKSPVKATKIVNPEDVIPLDDDTADF